MHEECRADGGRWEVGGDVGARRSDDGVAGRVAGGVKSGTVPVKRKQIKTSEMSKVGVEREGTWQ